jgi:hypothetical protein
LRIKRHLGKARWYMDFDILFKMPRSMEAQ